MYLVSWVIALEMAVANSPYYDESTRHLSTVNVFMRMSIVTFPMALQLIASSECLHNYFVSKDLPNYIKKTEILNFALICHYCQLLVKNCLNRGTCSKSICLLRRNARTRSSTLSFPCQQGKISTLHLPKKDEKKKFKRNLRQNRHFQLDIWMKKQALTLIHSKVQPQWKQATQN